MATLYIVATPIGNLDDFSPRAVQTLKQVNYVACEDTRTSGRLLNHYQIEAETFAFHQHNEHKKVDDLVRLLDARQAVALITDAGMPGISDPGFLAVRAAYQNGHTVSVIPGPDAATTALAASGLPCETYTYAGFLPAKKGRRKKLKMLLNEDRTVILYESPHRLQRLLQELKEQAGDQRYVAVARELTKKFEEMVRGPLFEVQPAFERRESIKGEITVVIAPQSYRE